MTINIDRTPKYQCNSNFHHSHHRLRSWKKKKRKILIMLATTWKWKSICFAMASLVVCRAHPPRKGWFKHCSPITVRYGGNSDPIFGPNPPKEIYTNQALTREIFRSYRCVCFFHNYIEKQVWWSLEKTNPHRKSSSMAFSFSWTSLPESW